MNTEAANDILTMMKPERRFTVPMDDIKRKKYLVLNKNKAQLGFVWAWDEKDAEEQAKKKFNRFENISFEIYG